MKQREYSADDVGSDSLSYIGQIVVPEGYTLVECGLVLADQEVTNLSDLIIGGAVNESAVQKGYLKHRLTPDSI